LKFVKGVSSPLAQLITERNQNTEGHQITSRSHHTEKVTVQKVPN